MEQMCVTMPAAYRRLLARGLLDPVRLPGALRQLELFVEGMNTGATEIGLPWHVNFRPYAAHINMGILVPTGAINYNIDIPFGAASRAHRRAASGAQPEEAVLVPL